MDHFLEQYGYLAIFIVAMIEAICIPFPSEVTFGFTASLAAQGKDGFHLLPIIVVGVLGEICGSVIAYFIGRYGGRAAVDRFGKYVLLTHRDLDRADRFMARHGDPAVLFGRIIPLLRAFISLVAGIGEMRFASFLIFTSIGTAIYGTGLAVGGYELGTEWDKLSKSLSWAGVAVAVVIVIAVVVVVAHRIKNLRAGRPVDAEGA